MNVLQYIEIEQFKLCSGREISIKISYQLFGQPLYEAPIVLVNHALTGNSQVIGKNGWWNAIVGENKVIDTQKYTVLAFNIPGNSFGKDNSETFSQYYKEFTAKDIALLFSEALKELQIHELFAVIGGSVGGGIAWELAAIRPNLIKHLIPIATDWKATDWLIANCYIQDAILNNSSKPLVDARMHAMTLYRTPQSFAEKFKRSKTENLMFKSESWLNYHGEKLASRFQLSAYKMMNQILKTIAITKDEKSFIDIAKSITSDIHIITINSDLFFRPEENWSTFVDLKIVKENVTIGEIKSIHGHDAFLIEYKQLIKLLKPIFKQKEKQNENHKLSYIRYR